MARSSVAVLASMLPALPPAAAAVPGGDAPPPNMLVVVLDDIGMDQSSFQPCGWNGAPESPSMPVLAEIAAKGVSFRNFWATPECSPSRAAMLTGRHSFRTGVVTAVVDPMLPAVQLHPSEMTLPKLLRPAGYVSGMLGKYHLGGGPENTPPGFGFLPLFNPTSIERMPIGVPTLVRYSRDAVTGYQETCSGSAGWIRIRSRTSK
jgi:arylsulfatase A-like enzyme